MTLNTLMQWAPGDKWHTIVELPQGHHIEYKYVLQDHHTNKAYWVHQHDGKHQKECPLYSLKKRVPLLDCRGSRTMFLAYIFASLKASGCLGDLTRGLPA